MTSITRLMKNENGQDIVEYALLSALVSTIAVAILESMGISLFILYRNVIEAFLVHY